MGAFVLVRSLFSGEVNLVWESDHCAAMTAADALAILGDRVPVIGWDDSGPGGRLRFPLDSSGARLGAMLRDQLNAALQAHSEACPAESFPEPGVPNVDADDFAEPAGGEGARVAAEEAAHDAAIKAAAIRSADLIYDHWRPGEHFVVAPDGDHMLCHVGVRLWVYACNKSGRVIDRVRLHTGLGLGDPALLVQVEGLTERVVVSVGVLSACARKVGA